MYPWPPGFHSAMGMPQSSSDGAGPSSLCSGAPSSVSALSDSDTDINPFIDDDERDGLLGDILSEEEEQEDDQEEEEEDGPQPPKRAKFMPSNRMMKILKAVTKNRLKMRKGRALQMNTDQLAQTAPSLNMHECGQAISASASHAHMITIRPRMRECNNRLPQLFNVHVHVCA